MIIATALGGAVCFATIVLIFARAAGREEWTDVDIFDAELLRSFDQHQHASEVQAHWLGGVSERAEIDNTHGGSLPHAAE